MFSRTSLKKFLWGQDFTKFVNSSITKNGSRNGNFVNGEFLSSSSSTSSISQQKSLIISNPSSDENLATFSCGNESIVNEALEAAHLANTRGGWNWQHSSNGGAAVLDSQKRSALFHTLANFLEEDLETIAKAEALNSGLTVKSVIVSLRHSVSWIRFCANWASMNGSSHQQGNFFSTTSSGDAQTSTTRMFATSKFESLGTVAVISTSYSTGGGLASAIIDIVSALAAGNSVIWKPSELTPLSSLLFASLISEAQFPPGVFNLVQGVGNSGGGANSISSSIENNNNNSVGYMLAKSSKVQCVSFSGKSTTASQIKTIAAQTNFKSVLCECEDVSSIFVGKSVKNNDNNNSVCFERALDCAMLAFRNSGQGIIPSGSPLIAPATPKRLVIHQDIGDEFLQRLVDERVQQNRWKLGHALDPSIDQGPMMNAQLQQKILDDIVFATTHKSKSRGMIADLVFGGFAPKFPGGKFVAPTCLINVDPSIPLWSSPVASLGPLLCVSTFSDDDAESARLLMRNKFAGSCYVFSTDRKEIEEFADGARDDVSVGTVWVNPDFNSSQWWNKNLVMNSGFSFEKRKISGNKIIGGGASIVEQYCRRKSVVEFSF